MVVFDFLSIFSSIIFDNLHYIIGIASCLLLIAFALLLLSK